MVRHFARERIFVAGDVMRVNLFPVRRVGRGRGAKRMPSRACQAALNHRNSVKLRKDIVQLNFPREVGGVTGRFDYGKFRKAFGRNPTEAEWKAYLARFVRRLKALYAQHGDELKMVKFTHVGRKSGNVHHHLIFSRIPAGVSNSEIEQLWTEVGYVRMGNLEYENGSVAHHVEYISNGSGECKWSCTRNCKRPQEEDYEDGTPASVHYVDGHVTMADAHYIDSHADDLAFIKQLYPGWEVRYVTVSAEWGGVDGEVCTLLPFGGPFVEIELYRAEAEREPIRLLGRRKGKENNRC